MLLNEKKSIAVLFGGRSAEHEISIITALQAISAMDTLKYTIVPVYVSTQGKWYTGKELLHKAFYHNLTVNLPKVTEVTLLPDPTIGGLLLKQKDGSFNSKKIPIDVYFLAFHGQQGEDGAIQGLLELADATHTGSGLLASAIAMNKYFCKKILENHAIPVLPGVLIKKTEAQQSLPDVIKKICHTQGLENFPLFVKPCNLGSSIGISIAHDIPSLQASLAEAFKYDREAIVEPCIPQLREINVSVMDGNPPQISVLEIPVSSGKVLTYEDKYLRGGKKNASSSGMAGLSRIINPPDLDPQIKTELCEYALKSYQLLNCSGICRFDFIHDLNHNKLYFNELNPLPGSFSYYLWEKNSPPVLYTELIDQMIRTAEERNAQKLGLETNFGFKALQKV